MSAAPHRSRAAARPAAVLWDMDGTLVDTEPYWIECEYELVAEHGGEWDDEKAHSLVGHDLRDSARIIRERGGVELPIDDIVNRLLDGVIERVNRKVPWRPGARDTLAALRKAGVPCALVTMSWKRFADAVVQALPPGTFAAVITGDEVSRGKPHPEPYQAAADALGLRPRQCIAVEDSPTGVRSAVAAGCRTYAVPNVVDIPAGNGYTVVRSLLDIDFGLSNQATGPAAAAKASGTARSDGAARRRARRRRSSLLAVLALAAAGTGVALAVRSAAPPPPLADIPISGWAPYWALPEAEASVAAHGSLLHEVSPFWYSATSATAVGLSANLTVEQTPALVAAATAQGALVIPTVTDGMPTGGMAAVLADPATRTQHVLALASLVAVGGFDGIDIDYETFAFEEPYDSWATIRPNWVAFVQELGASLHASGKLLVVTVPPIYDTERNPESGRWVYDYQAIGEVADRVRVMAYDYSFDEPGPIAPLNWVRTVLRAAKAAISDDTKIVLGVPLYGRNWVTGTVGTCPASAEGRVDITLRNIADLVTRRGAAPAYDERIGESTFTYQLDVTDGTATCTQTREVFYVDAAGARARVDLARAERIGGVAFWALGFDSDDVWPQLADVARPRPTDTAPPTTAPPTTAPT